MKERRYGEDYTIDNIKKRIIGIYLPENKTYYKNYFKRDEVIDNLLKLNCKGLAMRYIKYLKLLNNYPSYIKRNRISFEMQKDVMNMENISKQAILLASNNIKDEDDLINLYVKIRSEIKNNPSKELREKIKLIDEIRHRQELLVESNRENEKEVLIR